MSQYKVFITPEALQEVKELPGHIRQRVKQILNELQQNPHPAGCKQLTIPKSVPFELWRIRLDMWRIVYTITENEQVIDVLAIRKRPPYDYGDLERLLSEF